MSPRKSTKRWTVQSQAPTAATIRQRAKAASARRKGNSQTTLTRKEAERMAFEAAHPRTGSARSRSR